MITQSGNPHPGIAIHKVPVGADFPGLLFAVGMVLIFLIAVPALWFVLVAAGFMGIGVAWLLHFIHHSDACEECYSQVLPLQNISRR
jgi:hypothetical protein